MKNIIIGALLVIISSFAFSKREEKGGLGRVAKIEGKEIYLYSEPEQEYKVVTDYNNTTNVIPSCTLENLVAGFLKRAKKDKVNFDALLMDTSDNIYLIKFQKGAPKD